MLHWTERHLGGAPDCVAFAPGRVVIWGDPSSETPMWTTPSSAGVTIAMRTTWRGAHLDNVDDREQVALDLDELPTPADLAEAPSWLRFMVGGIAVVQGYLAQHGAPALTPFHAAFHSDLPREAGLAAGTALCVAWVELLAHWADVSLQPHDVVILVGAIQTEWLAQPARPHDVWAILLGSPTKLVRCDRGTAGPVPISPLDGHLWLVDCGVRGRPQSTASVPPQLAPSLHDIVPTDPTVIGRWLDALHTIDVANHTHVRIPGIDAFVDHLHRVPGVLGACRLSTGDGRWLLLSTDGNQSYDDFAPQRTEYHQNTGRTAVFHPIGRAGTPHVQRFHTHPRV